MSMVKVGSKAPEISCEAVVNNQIKKILLQDYVGAYKLLFFYPLDFTFVCPTELHALQANLDAFKQRNVQILAISVDSAYSHLAWLNTPMSKGGIEGVTYPLLADISKSISQKYGVLSENAEVALRGTFLLDRNDIVQYAAVNNLPLGRNISELIRIVDALQHVEKYGEVCPANWRSGNMGMTADQKGFVEYFQ